MWYLFFAIRRYLRGISDLIQVFSVGCAVFASQPVLTVICEPVTGCVRTVTFDEGASTVFKDSRRQ